MSKGEGQWRRAYVLLKLSDCQSDNQRRGVVDFAMHDIHAQMAHMSYKTANDRARIQGIEVVEKDIMALRTYMNLKLI